ncbi:MAG: dihydroneopterin aldolase [Phenylobacterium sp.]|uniref:dihydroneopterin aldolase n=1 Tax=Phenylobacterium sp. TaxID=1871053 RepID=UPI0025ED50BD|nr:dihydroneopterin aldolase [Phenylobacterium sp.]MCA3711485.1 dihydroneopterin aldolase [Phenylobacterium sp.]MCA3727032.1 dihydroneopterin aldolase [Phenylobacterium sp.]MCA3744767.1 dihydroneopterin aldolase [Phenylobacterium sp.]MCA6242328.1 dihydroneopterin aldolase [Phenylobacterium sp.]MCA6253891.1 dihydroneopterin aldolase [Phenylobacterium sp.]
MTAPAPPIVTRRQKVLVRGLRLEAFIGIYDHEKGRAQSLAIDVEIDLAERRVESLADTVNYEAVVDAVRRIASAGHIDLVETFAERLAEACLALEGALRVRVMILKPGALAPDAEAGGVELILERNET